MSRSTVSPLIKAQLERLTAGGVDISSGLRPVSSSPPIIIPKKPPRSNTSSQSSSLCTSLGDQMSASYELLSQLNREADNASNSLSASPHSASQQLEHAAARDRIAVKNKRQQPLRKKLSVLKERDDYQLDIFSNRFDDDEEFTSLNSESKIQSQSVIDLSQLQKAQSRLRVTPRSRDRSVDNILTSTSNAATYSPSITRAINFKRPQETKQTVDTNQSLLKTNKDEEQRSIQPEVNKHETVLRDINANESNKTPAFTNSSSKEHIYDNFYVFNRHKINIIPSTESNENESSTNNIVKVREHPTGALHRPRPVTMHIQPSNDKQKTNDFENVFNQIKHGPNKRIPRKEETKPSINLETPVKQPTVTIVIEPAIQISPIVNEPIIPIDIPPEKPIEKPSIEPVKHLKKPPISGILSANTRVNMDNNQPTPSWIDIAKQKQSKFPTALIEKTPKIQSEQSLPIESTEPSKKNNVVPSNESTLIKEATSSNDNQPSKKLNSDQAIIRIASTRRVQPTTNALERDSIRALKASNPNRINNLIQLFNK